MNKKKKGTKEKKESKKEKRKAKKPLSSVSFVIVLSALIVAVIGIIVFSIGNARQHWIELGRNDPLYNSIGIAGQIISGIVCCVISILGISISLQNNEFLGVPLVKYYSMRGKHYFTFRWGALISIGLLLFSAIGYIVSSIVICIGAAILSVAFGVYWLYTEVPYLTMKESVMIGVVQKRTIAEYEGRVKAEDYQSKDFNEVLESLISNKDIKWLYERLKIANDVEYNKYLLRRLMDVQTNMAFNLDKIETKSDFATITDSFLETICNMANGSFDIVQILGDDPKNYLHLLTRVLFRLLENPISKEKTEKRLVEELVSFFEPEKNTPKWDLYYSVLSIVFITKIKQNDFSLAKELKKEISCSDFSLHYSGIASRIFIMISFIMYYLAEVESEVPKETKDNIRNFIKKEGTENDTIILSWGNLFRIFTDRFAVSLLDFLSDFKKNEGYYDFMLRSSRGHLVVLDEELATDWYLAHFLNYEKFIPEYDFEKMFHASGNTQRILFLKRFEEECYSNEMREFEPSEKIINMVAFYSDEIPKFSWFRINERRNHSFREYVDSLIKQELNAKIIEASSVSNQNITEHFQRKIEREVQDCFGYNKEIDLSKEEKHYFALVVERDPHMLDFDKSVVRWFANGIFSEIRRKIDENSKRIDVGPSFAKDVKSLLTQEFEYVTSGVIDCGNGFLDEETREIFSGKVRQAKKLIIKRFSFPIQP